MRQLQCSWVPGTLNKVRMKSSQELIETTVDRVESVLGRGCLHDLYLKGRVTLNVNEECLRRLNDAQHKKLTA